MPKKTKKLIVESKAALKELMQEQLAIIGDSLVQQIMRRFRSATNAQRYTAIKDLSPSGLGDYRAMLLTAFSVIALDALKQVKGEVPKAKNVKLSESEDDMQLSEFDRLPKTVQKRIKAKTALLVDTQTADLEKGVAFQFTSSVDSTDSEALIEKDLKDAAAAYIGGVSVEAASGVSAAEVVNQTRREWFQQDEVMDELDAFEFVNEDPVSPICQDLVGTIFAKDDPGADRYYPPLHWNCKSSVNPVIKGMLGEREIKDLKPSKASLDDYVQLSEGGRCSCGCH